MPITWRNVGGDSTRGAALLFETARRAFGDGMANFQGIVDSRNQLNQQNWDTQKEVNTDQFLDRLAQYKTPEELAAAQQAGELQALKAQFGGQIDRDAVRNAETNAAEELMRRITTQNQYGDDTRRRSERDQMDIGRNFLLDGNYKGFDKWATDNNLLDEAQLHEMKRTNMRQDAADSRAQQQLNFAAQRASQEATLFNQEQDERARGIALGQAILSGAQEVRNYDAGEFQAVTQVADKLGIQLDDSGMPKFGEGAIGNSSKKLFFTELEKLGITPQSNSERLQGFSNRVMSSDAMKGMTLDEMLAARQGLEKGITSLNDLSESDKAQLSAEQEAVIADRKIKTDFLKKEHQSQRALNPFVGRTTDLEKDIAEIMDVIPKDRDFFGDNQRQLHGLNKQVRTYLEEGFSPDFIKNAVKAIQDEGTTTDDAEDNLTEYINSYMEERPDTIKAMREDAKTIESRQATELNDYDAQLNASLRALERRYRSSRGLSPEKAGDYTSRLFRLNK